jgi:nitrogen PTS system EIIA component
MSYHGKNDQQEQGNPLQLTTRDVARLLNVSEKTIYRWVEQKSIPAYRINNQYRFNRAEILEWAVSRKVRVSPRIFDEPETSNTPLPTLSEAFHSGGIHYRMEGSDKETALRSIVHTMHLPPDLDREFLFSVLLAREALGSTAVGDGIAIPHVRNPVILQVTAPSVSVCFFDEPVDFGALDGLPVRAFFCIISPSIRAHLHLLSRLAYALGNPGFKSAVRRQASRQELLQEVSRIEHEISSLAPAPARS